MQQRFYKQMNGAIDSDERVSSADAATHHGLNHGRRSPRKQSALRCSGGNMRISPLLWFRRGPTSPYGRPHSATTKITRGSGPWAAFDYLTYWQLTPNFETQQDCVSLLRIFLSSSAFNTCSHESLSDTWCAERKERRETMSGIAKEKNRIAQRAYRERQKVLIFVMCLVYFVGIASDDRG
jgi:hypothetical protein